MGYEAPPMVVPGDRTLIFTYGTLKRGFSNHKLIHSLIQSDHASFIGPATTSSPLPLVCGPYRVPFLLNISNPHSTPPIHRVSGELYSVSPLGLARLDELEGIDKGHYERLPLAIRVKLAGEEDEVEVKAEGYFGHRSYAAEMWRRSGEKGLREYTKEVATGYVRRLDRPQGISFLDHVNNFVQSSQTEIML